MYKVEFMITNGQHKRWSQYLKRKFGKGKSFNRMTKLSIMFIVAEMMTADARRAVQRLDAVNNLTKGGNKYVISNR